MTEETALASVIEPSESLEIQVKELSIVTNIEGVRAYVKKALEPFKGSEFDISTPELEKQANQVLKGLRDLKKAISRKRIDSFTKLLAPVTALEDEVKALETEIEKAVTDNQKIINDKKELAEAAREKALKTDYEGTVGEEITKLIPYDKIKNSSWKTKSYGAKKAENELFEKCQSIIRDMKILGDAKLDNREEVLAHYCANVDLQAAMEYDKSLTEKKAEDARKAEAAAKAFKITASVRPKAPEPPKPAAKDVEHELSDYVVIMRGVSAFDVRAVAKFAADTTGTRPELKTNVWMKKVGI